MADHLEKVRGICRAKEKEAHGGDFNSRCDVESRNGRSTGRTLPRHVEETPKPLLSSEAPEHHSWVLARATMARSFSPEDVDTGFEAEKSWAGQNHGSPPQRVLP